MEDNRTSKNGYIKFHIAELIYLIRTEQFENAFFLYRGLRSSFDLIQEIFPKDEYEDLYSVIEQLESLSRDRDLWAIENGTFYTIAEGDGCK